MSMMQTTYTVDSLATLWQVTERAVQSRAKSEGWTYSIMPGRGAKRIYDVPSMPATTRDMLASALLRQERAASGDAVPTLPAPAQSSPAQPSPVPTARTAALPLAPSPTLARASQRERRVALARLALVREVERLAPLVGKEKAIMHLVEAARHQRTVAHGRVHRRRHHL